MRTQTYFDEDDPGAESREANQAFRGSNASKAELRTDELIREITGSSPRLFGDDLDAEMPLEKFPDLTLQELSAISPDFGPEQHKALLAAVELGRRVAEAKRFRAQRKRISSSGDAKVFCREHFSRLAEDALKEEFHIITLDMKNGVIGTHLISIGTLTASLVHPREVFRPAVQDSACSIIAVHNHPSGDHTASEKDLLVTRRLIGAGETLGIDLIDHIVISINGATSIREAM